MDFLSNIILYVNRKKICLSVIIDQKGDSQFVVFSENNQRQIVSRDKVFVFYPIFIRIELKNFELLNELRGIRKQLQKEAAQVDLELLYNLETEKDKIYHFEQLTQLYFGNLSSEEMAKSSAKMLFALSEDKLFFSSKQNGYSPRSEKDVKMLQESHQRFLKAREKQKKEKEIALEQLKHFFTDSNPSKNEIPSYKSFTELANYIDPLKKWLLKRESNVTDVVLERVNELNCHFSLNMQPQFLDVFNLCSKLGVFRNFFHFILMRHSLDILYITRLTQESILSEDKNDFKFHGSLLRRDLRHCPVITIDSECTNDRDDAISIEECNDGYQIGVHITDVSHLIDFNSSLDEDALQLGSSIYTVEEILSMLPAMYSDNELSLKQGQERPTLSFLFYFDSNLELKSKSACIALICISKNMDYHRVDEWISKIIQDKLDHSDALVDEESVFSSKLYSILYRIASSLNTQRKMKGAFDFRREEVKMKLTENHDIQVTKEYDDLKSHLIVRELMILANVQAAEFCTYHNIPIGYLVQEMANVPVDENHLFNQSDGLHLENQLEPLDEKVAFYEKLRRIKKSYFRFTPAAHVSLGVDFYTRATSPIRRYHDLLIHRQIKAYLVLKKHGLYSEEQLKNLVWRSEQSNHVAQSVEKEMHRFWLLCYLDQEQSRLLVSTVIRKVNKGFLVELDDICLSTFIRCSQEIQLGIQKKVRVVKVDPYLDILECCFVDEQID